MSDINPRLFSRTNEQNKANCLLLITGSVASIKLVPLVRRLQQQQFNVRVAATTAALHFVQSAAGEREATNATAGAIAPDATSSANDSWNRLRSAILRDADEWSWDDRGDDVLHISLKNWADIAIVAPLSANTLAKVAHGLADNLVTCVLRAWPVGTKPLVLAPAMNTDMWRHPITQLQLDSITSLWQSRGAAGEASLLCVVPPVTKVLVCGEQGAGAMAPIDDIVAAAERLARHQRGELAKLTDAM